jgi:flavin reductase (DIM6/NTAB) family NADH-FMN oxidoreductase RutF
MERVLPPFEARQLRNALGRFPTGVTVITTRTSDGKREGLTANSFAALSLDPPLVLWSLGSRSKSLPSFQRAGRFVINVLGADQAELSHRFATPSEDKFEGLDIPTGLGGCPLLPEALACFECETHRSIELGDHWLFVGCVMRFGFREGAPLAFHAGKYGSVAASPGPYAKSDLDAIWGGLG